MAGKEAVMDETPHHSACVVRWTAVATLALCAPLVWAETERGRGKLPHEDRLALQSFLKSLAAP